MQLNDLFTLHQIAMVVFLNCVKAKIHERWITQLKNFNVALPPQVIFMWEMLATLFHLGLVKVSLLK